jgi:Lar family restriction alleviation protein
MPDSTPSLLPCPFCGSADTDDVLYCAVDEYHRAYVTCSNCFAEGPVVHDKEIGSDEAIEQAAAAWNQRSTWQPIETAPRDGTDFIAYNKFTGPYITAAKSISPIAAPPDGTIRFPMHYWHGQKGTWFPEPTHWQPLPSPPPITP